MMIKASPSALGPHPQPLSRGGEVNKFNDKQLDFFDLYYTIGIGASPPAPLQRRGEVNKFIDKQLDLFVLYYNVKR